MTDICLPWSHFSKCSSLFICSHAGIEQSIFHHPWQAFSTTRAMGTSVLGEITWCLWMLHNLTKLKTVCVCNGLCCKCRNDTLHWMLSYWTPAANGNINSMDFSFYLREWVFLLLLLVFYVIRLGLNWWQKKCETIKLLLAIYYDHFWITICIFQFSIQFLWSCICFKSYMVDCRIPHQPDLNVLLFLKVQPSAHPISHHVTVAEGKYCLWLWHVCPFPNWNICLHDQLIMLLL